MVVLLALVQTSITEFRIPVLVYKVMAIRPCNPRTEEVETEDTLELSGLSSVAESMSPKFSKKACLTQQDGDRIKEHTQ